MARGWTRASLCLECTRRARASPPTLVACLPAGGACELTPRHAHAAALPTRLETLGVISESDYAPFVKQFHKFDKTGDGRLDGADLALLVKSARRATVLKAEGVTMARLALRAQAGAARQRLHEHARNLVVPTFLASFGFMWYMVRTVVGLHMPVSSSNRDGAVMRVAMSGQRPRAAPSASLPASDVPARGRSSVWCSPPPASSMASRSV